MLMSAMPSGRSWPMLALVLAGSLMGGDIERAVRMPGRLNGRKRASGCGSAETAARPHLSKTGDSLLSKRGHRDGNVVVVGARSHTALAGRGSLPFSTPEHVAEHSRRNPSAARRQGLSKNPGVIF